jgi:hypothetical protein
MHGRRHRVDDHDHRLRHLARPQARRLDLRLRDGSSGHLDGINRRDVGGWSGALAVQATLTSLVRHPGKFI